MPQGKQYVNQCVWTPNHNHWSVMILEPVQTKVSGIWLLEDSQHNV